MPVEKPNFGHFHEILPFSTGNKLVTKPIFQSNSITVVWRMYRGKGFVWQVIGIEALLASYYQLQTHFLLLWIQNGFPMACHWQPNWVPIDYQLAPDWYPIGHHSRLSGSIGGAILFYEITYRIINI